MAVYWHGDDEVPLCILHTAKFNPRYSLNALKIRPPKWRIEALNEIRKYASPKDIWKSLHTKSWYIDELVREWGPRLEVERQ